MKKTQKTDEQKLQERNDARLTKKLKRTNQVYTVISCGDGPQTTSPSDESHQQSTSMSTDQDPYEDACGGGDAASSHGCGSAYTDSRSQAVDIDASTHTGTSQAGQFPAGCHTFSLRDLVGEDNTIEITYRGLVCRYIHPRKIPLMLYRSSQDSSFEEVTFAIPSLVNRRLEGKLQSRLSTNMWTHPGVAIVETQDGN